MSSHTSASPNAHGTPGEKKNKPGTRPECFSATEQHAETTDHDIHPKYVELKEIYLTNLSQRLFLESWHSQADKKCHK